MPAPGGWSPFCHAEAEPPSRSVSPGPGKRYGLQRVRRVFGLARSSAYYLQAQAAVPQDQRPAPKKRGPIGAASDADLVGSIRQALADSPFVGEGYRKVRARSRRKGVRTAAEPVRRLMREHHLQAPRKGGPAHGPVAHDGTITTEKPDEMWGTDMTTTVTTVEGTAHVLVAVGHCTGECVGLHAARGGNRFEALGPLRRGVRHHFGQFGAGAASGLSVRHDHGSNDLSHDLQQELRSLWIISSPSFVREPEGNGCAERFIRTPKGQLLWVRSFATVAELVEALRQSKATYNERWLIGRHGHRTPSQVRRDLVGSRTAAA